MTSAIPRRLPHREKAALAWEILREYVRVRILLRRFDVEEVVRRLRAVSVRDAPPLPLIEARRLGTVVGRGLRLLPADGRCLMRSLVLLRLLARRGMATRLVIGVRVEPAFGAHAWIEHADEPLLPAGDTHGDRLLEV